MALIAAIIIGVWWFDGAARWLVIAAGLVIEIVEAMGMLWWSRRRRSVTGSEGLIGRTAVVVDACAPRGRVRIDGELWNASAPRPAARGEHVQIVAVRGLELEVAPVATPPR